MTRHLNGNDRVTCDRLFVCETRRYRDVSVYGKGFAKEWNSHTVFEIKWDANRDPDQKFSVTFKTNTSDIADGEQFLGLLIIEYPGRIVNTDLQLKYIGTRSLYDDFTVSDYDGWRIRGSSVHALKISSAHA